MNKKYLIIKSAFILGFLLFPRSLDIPQQGHISPVAYIITLFMSFVVWAVASFLILKKLMKGREQPKGNIWCSKLSNPISLAHLIGWGAIASMFHILIRGIFENAVHNDLLIPVSAGLGMGIGILIGVRNLMKENKKSEQ